VQHEGGTVFARNHALRAIKAGLFEADFRIDVRAETITCPAGEVEFEPGETVHFDPEVLRRLSSSRELHASGQRQRT
jgi:hypothetical protein